MNYNDDSAGQGGGGAPIMAYRNGQPIYYGSPEAHALAMQGLANVKAKYGTKGKMWRNALQAAMGVLGPDYNGPTMEQSQHPLAVGGTQIGPNESGPSGSGHDGLPPVAGDGQYDLGGDVMPSHVQRQQHYGGLASPDQGAPAGIVQQNHRFVPPPQMGMQPHYGGVASPEGDDTMLYRALHQAMLTKMSPASRNLLAMRHLMKGQGV